MKSKTINNSKQMTINMLAAVVSFSINVGINFFLTPYLVKELGTEAYGFIGLANNFVQYASIVTAALNSMAGRFISIEYHKGEIDKASRYFSSVLVANGVIAMVMLLAGAIVTLTLECFLNISPDLVNSVKITFALTFLTFVVSVITAIFTTAAFVRNKLYINSIRDIISNSLKLILVIGLFSFLPAQLYFLALATLASGIFLLITNITVKKKILPEVKIKPSLFSFKLVKNILSAGVWCSVGYLCNALNTGLDLLICNITISATMMGLLSVAKTIPHCIDNLITTISNIFTPRFTILYAKGEKDKLVSENKFSTKVLSFIMTVPLAGFMAFGYDFYTLWQPTKTPEEIQIIQTLSVLACISFLCTCHSKTLYSMFTVCNKLKPSVLISFGSGVLNVILVLILVNFTDLGVYAIAGVSSVLISIKALTFVPLYTAHILKVKPTTYYSSIIRGWICFFVVLIFFMGINHFVTIGNWLTLIVACGASALVGYVISVPLIFSKKEMGKLKTTVMKKLKKG